MNCTTMKQKAYRRLAFFEMRTETVDQLVSLPWRTLVLCHFEEKIRTTPKIHTLIAITFVRIELQLTLVWCIAGLTTGEYDPEERQRARE